MIRLRSPANSTDFFDFMSSETYDLPRSGWRNFSLSVTLEAPGTASK